MKKLVRSIILIWSFWLIPPSAQAEKDFLEMTTKTQVSPVGRVLIELNLKNISGKTLHQIEPMFHFHHSMSPLPKIKILLPGETRSFKNDQHPVVLRSGRYPLVAMAKYQDSINGLSQNVQTFMSFFDYREKLRSAVSARLESTPGKESSLIKIFLENHSDSFKNLRLMLLLPKGLISRRFQGGMLGFTIRGGEQKIIEIPVTRSEGVPAGQYAVYLMTEYAEMEKHFSDETRGVVSFEASWRENSVQTCILMFTLLVFGIGSFYKAKRGGTLKSSYGNPEKSTFPKESPCQDKPSNH